MTTTGTDSRRLRLGTRGSRLALTQSGQVAEALIASGGGGAAAAAGKASEGSGGLSIDLVTVRTDGDGDRFAHFVRKDKANSSMVTGQPVVALCGKVWIPTRDASQYPVCPTCKELRDSMGKNGRNWPFSDGGKGSGK